MPVGLTKDAGWQVGATRTYPVAVEEAWDFLLSPEGLAIWLGEVGTPLAKGEEYATSEGARGEVRTLHPRNRIRLTWQPPGRAADATVQLVVVASARGCSVRFHTERLESADERERMKAHWRQILDRLDGHLGA